jgi:hypothetical protein
MSIITRTHVRSFIVCLSLCMFSGVAEAAIWRTCNGSAVKWRGTLNIHRNRCSIPDTGNTNRRTGMGSASGTVYRTSWTGRS